VNQRLGQNQDPFARIQLHPICEPTSQWEKDFYASTTIVAGIAIMGNNLYPISKGLSLA